ncbi:class I SAM-dependent methyltransferase [Helicovermis profundi]|uniref:Class I SAM-dependent methyltransferase n=1 Tax=Helicovermis profundi TaxID=3065157 RepID=A0AAU9ECX2_9FIRM|nr:class I SAM-dependent methyltransferase [Clostridia bacterium S502]
MNNCKICGKETEIYYDKQFDTEYFHCTNCEFIQMDLEKKITFAQEREVYNLHENSLEDEGYVSMFNNFLDKGVLDFIDSGKALDFGSGPTPVLSEIIKREYDFSVDCYDLHYQPKKIYEGKTYDLVLSTEVLEHIENPIEVFTLIYDRLRINGIFSFMTIFHYNDKEKFLNWWYRRDKTHISFYSIKTLQFIAEKIGFEIIYTDNKRICTFRKI